MTSIALNIILAFSNPAQAATPSYLFTVQAIAGSTISIQAGKGEDERFTLTLRGVDPVTKFADRPFRTASVISPATLVTNWKAWFANSPPNAVLTFSNGSSKAPSSFVMQLTRPKYDQTKRTLSFTAVRIYRSHDPSLKGFTWQRPTTPRIFTGASLFIDNSVNSESGILISALERAMQPYVFSPNNSTTWNGVEASFSTILTHAWQQGILMGQSAAAAFSVTCEPTANQILDGYLSCNVTMQLTRGGSFSTTLTQIMAISG